MCRIQAQVESNFLAAAAEVLWLKYFWNIMISHRNHWVVWCVCTLHGSKTIVKNETHLESFSKMSYFYLFFVYVSHAGYPVASICKISGHIATSTDLSPGLFGHTAHGQRLRDRAHDGDVFWDLDTPCMGLVRDVEGLRRRYKMCHGYKSIVWHSWKLRWQGWDDCFPRTNSIDHIVKHGTRRYPHGSSRFESHYLKATKFEKLIAPTLYGFVFEMEPLEIYEVTAF